VTRAWTHWATSRDLTSLRLPAHDAGTGLTGRRLGVAQHGGSFVLDPFDAYALGLVSNPNVVVAGSIGAGKSTVVKMMVDRALERGRRVVVVDPKGEYADLARAYGVVSVALGRDGWCDPFPDADADGLALVRALVASAQGAALSAEELYVVDDAWRGLGRPRPGRVLHALYEAVASALDDSRPSPTRSLALTLHRFVHGDLAGLFDGAGEPLGLATPVVVLDLSAQWSASSLPVAALSAVAAAQRVAGARGELGYLVLDEAWALLAEPHAMRWLQGSWKLARSRGLSHVVVLHRFSDVAAAGDEGSAQRERARGLLRECETAWLFRQPPDEAREMAVALGLQPLEERYLCALPKGSALVRYGAYRSVVRVMPDARDLSFVDTDAAMREAAT
jgi:type IV secretory pathway VirB4 component